jgi:2-pyrone-4,6-dicarboxylate lactonase
VVDTSIRVPDIPAPVRNPHAPKIAFPTGACDCHAHIFGPQDRYPLLPKTHFVPHVNPLSDYLRLQRMFGCERGVLVQPSVYGTDNSLIVEALQSHSFDLRAVAVVAAGISDGELEKLH